MPFVVLKYKKGALNYDTAEGLISYLTSWTAMALDCPGDPEARVRPTDVEVEERIANPRDRNAHDISVTIKADLNPQRLANLESIRKQIQAQLQAFLSQRRPQNLRCCVWVRLAPGSFGFFFANRSP